MKFWYRLSDEFGIPVRPLKKLFTSRDYIELQLYRKRNPHWSTKIIDQLALVSYMIYVVNAKDAKLKFEDFVFKYDGGKRRQSQQEMEFIARMLCHNAHDS